VSGAASALGWRALAILLYGLRMADLPPDPDSNEDTGEGTPRWVSVFGIVAVVFTLLGVVLHLTGHGRGGHVP
jgi:hypothetical protein